MEPGNSVVNLGEISKPATVLIEKISEAVGGIFKPWQIKRVAKADAAAEIIKVTGQIQSEELVQRAMHRFVQEETNKQFNIESITANALPGVADDAKPENIDKDWLANFFDKCRIVSDEQMQDLWSKVLAGEANTPGKFSKRTVNFLSELDKSDAEIFQTLMGCAVNGNAPLIYKDQFYDSVGLTFAKLTHLDAIGLIRYNALTGFQSQKLGKLVLFHYFGSPIIVELPKAEGNVFDYGNVMLTNVGAELATLCGAVRNEAFLKFLKTKWESKGYQTLDIIKDAVDSFEKQHETTPENKSNHPGL